LNEVKRRKILLGMLEAVGAEGYERASVRSAIKRAGVYRQAFYDHFADKEECYLAALDDGIARASVELRTSASAGSDWRGRMRAALATLLAGVEADPEVARALLVEVHAAGPEAVTRQRRALEAAARQVDLARLEATEDAPAIAAEAVTAGILAVLHSRIAEGKRGGYAELLPDLAYLAVLPYFGPESAAEELRPARR
jgi:AcrR family transcriptional regulator